MTSEEIKTLMQEAVKAAVKEHLAEFYIEREQHYLDHRFINDIRIGTEKIKGTACSAVTKSMVAAGIILVLWGVIHWTENLFGLKVLKP